MGSCLKNGVRELAQSTNPWLVVRCQPLHGIQRVYDLEFNPDSVLLIGGPWEGTTTYPLN